MTLNLVSYPRHNGLFVRVITSSSYVINKSLYVLHTIFYALCISFVFYFIKISMPSYTHPHIETADPHPLWIPLVMVLLLPIINLKVRSTKQRMKVRKIVKYHKSLPDCYNRKKEQYNLMKRRLRQWAWVLKRIRKKSR